MWSWSVQKKQLQWPYKWLMNRVKGHVDTPSHPVCLFSFRGFFFFPPRFWDLFFSLLILYFIVTYVKHLNSVLGRGDDVDTVCPDDACRWGALRWAAELTSSEGWSQRDGWKMPLAGSDCETVWIAHSQTVRSHNRQLNKSNKTYHSAKSQSAPTKAWMEQIEDACRYEPAALRNTHSCLHQQSRWIIKGFWASTSQRTEN